MRSELCLVVPELDAGAGGVADYTLRLVEEWPVLDNLRYLVPRKTGVETRHRATTYPLTEFGRDASAFTKSLPANDGTVFLQYSAYGFDRLGFPRCAFAESARLEAGTRRPPARAHVS